MPGEYRPRAVAAAGGIDVDAVAMRRGGPAAPAPGSAWRDPVTWALAAVVFGAYFVLSLFRLLRLSPASYDLGIYTEYVKQLSQLHAPVVDVLGPGFNLLGNHFQVAVAVLAPFFRLVPSPATLLFFQALATAISVFPVVSAGFALSGKATGRLIGFAYGFSWGLQQMIVFDFHEIALAVPLLAFSLSALVRRRPLAAICWAMPLVFVEESQGFTVAAIGLLLATAAVYPGLLPGPAVRGRLPAGQPAAAGGRAARRAARRRHRGGRRAVPRRVGPVLVGVRDHRDHPALQPGPRLLLLEGRRRRRRRAVRSPSPRCSSQLAHGWPVKLETVVLLLLPTAFAALGSPVALLALPSLALRFMSVNTAYWGTGVALQRHRDAGAVHRRGRGHRPLGARAGARRPPAGEPGAAPGAAGRRRGARPGAGAWRWRGRRGRPGPARRGHGGGGRGGARLPVPAQRPVARRRPTASTRTSPRRTRPWRSVPDGVTVQTNLDLLAPLAARTDTFWIGNPGNPLTQYVVFDNDDSGYSAPITNVPAFIAMLYPNDGYVQVFQRDGVYVFRRG